MQPFSPARKRGALPIALTLLTLGALLLVSISSPANITGPSHSSAATAGGAHPGLDLPVRAATHAGQPVSSVARPTSIVGPIGGKVYQTNVSAPRGNVSSNFVAVDPVTGILYSLNRNAGTLTSIQIGNGTLLHSYRIAYNPSVGYPYTIVVNHTLNHVYVAVASGTAPHGWVLVLDATTLAVVANVTTFGSDPFFQPRYLTYDPFSAQVLVENVSAAVVAILNTSTNTVTTVLTPSCSPSLCDSVGGMAPVPRHEYVVLPTRTSIFPTINTSSNLIALGFSGTANFTAGIATYDSAQDCVWVDNRSSGSQDIQVWNGAGGYVGSVKGPTSVQAMAYDVANDRVVVASLNYSVAGYADEIWDFDGVFGVLLTHFHEASSPAFSGFSSLAIVENGTGDTLVTGGPYNESTQVLAVTVTPPYLAFVKSIRSFNLIQGSPAVDPAIGVFYVNSAVPYEIQAFSEANPDAPLWTVPSPGFLGHVAAVDPVQGLLYVASPGNGSVLTYNAATGQWIGTTPIGFLGLQLYDDAANHLLYIGGFGGGVAIYSTVSAGMTFVATVNLPGVSLCAVSVDPAREVLYVASCATSPGNVTEVSGRTHAIVHVFPAGSRPDALAVGGTGLLYVGNAASQNISILNPATNATVGAIATPGFGSTGLAANPSGDWLYSTNFTHLVMQVVDGENQTVAGSISLPAVPFGDAVDPTTNTVVTSTVYDGTTFLASIVAAPAAPTGLALVRGNDSLTASWNAVVPPGGLPVVNYTIYTSTSASGPWTFAQSTTSTSATLSGLTDGTTYYAVVRAASEAGVSPVSTSASGTPAGVPYPPTSVAVTANGSSGLKVTWGAPASTDGAAVTNYTVFYTASTSGAWHSASAGIGTSWSLSGLSSGTTYSVRVVAFNSVGASNPSASASASTAALSTSGSPLGGSLLWIVIAVVVLAVVIAAVLLMMRRRKGPPKPWSPPASSASPPTSMPAWSETPPPSSGGPPPGAMGPPPGAT